MNNDDSFDNVVKTLTRIITIIYVFLAILLYRLFSVEFVFYRFISGAAAVVLVFIITGSKKLTRRRMSVLAPFSLALIELIVVTLVGGDRLFYFIMIGCVLISLTYVDTLGLFIMIILTT
ncbi:MAG: hypothetical protein FWF55_00480, partial [Treponema sp.]|nr:hypothetical protein [Treponema sp.]